jgi:catechol 2,3-dioxygenase-like lactoylglutathione lyase family enzyme
MLAGLHHITLISSDIARTARFYTDVLGLRLVLVDEDLATPGTRCILPEWLPASTARN